MLAGKHLSRGIQQGGDAGHDSKEDALATGDLVRLRVAEEWKGLRATGWRFIEGKLVPPGGADVDVDADESGTEDTDEEMEEAEEDNYAIAEG